VSVTGTVALTSEILYPIVKRETLKMSTLHSPFSFLAVHLLVETIGNGSSSRLIDDAEDVYISDGTRILGSLTLGVLKAAGGWGLGHE
jgi:hypothetical protein